MMKKIVLALFVLLLSQGICAKARHNGVWSLVSNVRLKMDTISVVDNTERLLAEADSLARLYRGEARKSVMYLPIVFTGYDIVPERGIERPAFVYRTTDEPELSVDSRWLDDARWQSWFERYHVMRVAFESPELVPYYFATMAEPPILAHKAPATPFVWLTVTDFRFKSKIRPSTEWNNPLNQEADFVME